ncbi:MAG: phosphoribosylglycinamide formyltransferase, partial [Deltaproteobacteria bacterium]|nr:phosphoribosylglycinamide formyltransferase [Deltaproteobacteria bacterium]
MSNLARVGVLVSGRGSNLQALLDAAADPWFPADIVQVVSNVPGAYALERAALAGVAASTVVSKGLHQ